MKIVIHLHILITVTVILLRGAKIGPYSHQPFCILNGQLIAEGIPVDDRAEEGESEEGEGKAEVELSRPPSSWKRIRMMLET